VPALLEQQARANVIACSGQVLAHRPHCRQLRSRKERRGASAAAFKALAGQALVHDMHKVQASLTMTFRTAPQQPINELGRGRRMFFAGDR
jgi:hypothetical protein